MPITRRPRSWARRIPLLKTNKSIRTLFILFLFASYHTSFALLVHNTSFLLPSLPLHSTLVIPASLARISDTGALSFLSLVNRYQCSVWYARHRPSACLKLNLNTSQRSVPNNIFCCIEGTALKSMRFFLPSMLRKTVKIPAILLVLPLNERIRELLGSKYTSKCWREPG